MLCPQLHYHHDYTTNIKGTNTAPAITLDTERVKLANFIQSDVCCSSTLQLHTPNLLFICSKADKNHWWLQCYREKAEGHFDLCSIAFSSELLQICQQETHAYWLLHSLWHAAHQASPSQHPPIQQCMTMASAITTELLSDSPPLVATECVCNNYHNLTLRRSTRKPMTSWRQRTTLWTATVLISSTSRKSTHSPTW